ncbi:MAG: hypothetical protein DRR16_32465 [Candidatus Parabeggiatoa sp. nov. 3]|nr:MAG: hypothetical protein DRR00_10780 [Gammaproteobacteria bacterium]RKZ58372.1 MAG: hypothetical protein DRQ99_25545 [Gammaproteobacteria bacterium]RKZ74074.1 MAG: hypothetical protein DRR16_32465 [Gammaproteobacteria bacterium]
MYAKGLRGFINLLLVCVLTGSLSYAAVPFFNEYQAKANYLLRFSEIMSWPSTAFNNADTPIRICLLGESLNHFEALLLDQRVKGRTIKVLHFLETWYNLKELDICHILFISQSEQPLLSNILAYTQHSPILTVSEIEDFVLEGGMIQFYKRDNQVRFMLDPETIEEAGIIIQIY